MEQMNKINLLIWINEINNESSDAQHEYENDLKIKKIKITGPGIVQAD